MSEASEWVTIRFGDLIEGCRGVSYQPHDLLDDYTEDSVVLLRANNIQKGRLQFNNIQVVPKKLVKKAQYLSTGDIAVCMSNGSKHLVGKSAQLIERTNFNCTIGAFCSVFKSKERTDSKFIKQLFLSDTYQAHIDLSLAGSAINNLKNSDIESIVFKVPSTAIQRKIGDILSTIDRTITHTEALIEKYQQIKAGLMHDLFTRGIGADGKLRPTREQAPELYRESAIGWIPKEWECEALNYGLSASPKNGFSPKEVDTWQDVYVLGLGCLTRNGFRPTQLKNAPKNALLSGAKLEDGDFLISRSNTQELVGLCGIYRDIGNNVIYPDLMMKLKFNQNLVGEFLEKYLLSKAVRQRISAIAVGTSGSMVKINATTLKALKIVYPKSDEQIKIVEKLEPIEKQVVGLETQLNKLKKQKSGLMHDLLTGKVQVNIAEAEVAHG